MTVQQLREKLAKTVADLRAIDKLAKTENRSFTDADRTNIDNLTRQAQELKAQIDEAQKDEQRSSQIDDLEASLAEPEQRRGDLGLDDDEDDGRERRSVAGRDAERRLGRELRWTRPNGEVREINLPEHRNSRGYLESMRHYLRTGQERRDLAANVATEGGYLLPSSMVAGILKFVDNAVFVRNFATVIDASGLKNIGQVSLDADPDDADWTGELSTGTDDTGMKFGKRELNPNDIAKRLKVSRNLLRAKPDIESFITQRLGYKFGVTMEKAYMTGNGANQPLGIFTASTSGIPTTRDVSTGNTTTQPLPDAFIRAKGTLKQQYRGAPTTRWILHRDIVTQAMLWKDGNGQYIWRQGLVAGEPDSLLGIPIAETEYAPNTLTTGQYVAALGDLSFYYIADSLDMEIQRLVELYAQSNQVGFIGRYSGDGMPALAEAFVRVALA